MSVTDSDEHIKKASEKLEQARLLLKEAQAEIDLALDEDTWGSDSWKQDFRVKCLAVKPHITAIRAFSVYLRGVA